MEKMPIFVKVEEYEEVLSIIDDVKQKIADAKKTLIKINDLKNEEDHQIETWQNSLEEVEKKIEYIDNSLSEPENL
jgi:phosphomevalonate kinase